MSVTTLIISAWLSVVALALGVAQRPGRASCAAGWHHNGVGPSGLFACTPNPVGDPDWDGTWRRPDRSSVPSGFLLGKIYCTNGATPIVVSARVVGCQRGSSRGSSSDASTTVSGE